MYRRTKIHSVKPMLEQLDERALPSFLLSGNVVPQMAQPLNNMVADMQSASADLKTQYQTIVSFGIEDSSNPNFTTDLPVAETAYGKAVGDWQRILTDQHAIQAVSNADLTFLSTVAFMEFSQGDATDLLVLKFGPQLGLNATAPLTNPVSQANSIVNDPTLQADITTDFAPLSPLYTTATIAQEAQTPSF
jgi:archaellum component FlaG (FlaF/FlaG flagellin family)